MMKRKEHQARWKSMVLENISLKSGPILIFQNKGDSRVIAERNSSGKLRNVEYSLTFSLNLKWSFNSLMK